MKLQNEILEYIEELESETNVRFNRLKRICENVFGVPRIKGSHHIFKTPWPGDPRINIQKDGKDAKPYQVKQVKKALEKQLEQFGDQDADGV